MINSLSAELNIMRPSMLETGLESVAYNLNRKNNDLRFFDFGKTYSTAAKDQYDEQDHLCLYMSGNSSEDSWRTKASKTDFYTLKGVIEKLLQLAGVPAEKAIVSNNPKFENAIHFIINGESIVTFGSVAKKTLQHFDIKQPVLFADFNWTTVLKYSKQNKIQFKELVKYPAVQRDLAMVVSSDLAYEQVEKTVQKIHINTLQGLKLFDIFESDKLGIGKKSMAVSFTFSDEEKTLTDKEIDGWMNKIMSALEKELQAEIRK